MASLSRSRLPKEKQIEIEVDQQAFNDIYWSLLDDETALQILYGGSSSGKSKFVAQRSVYDILSGKRNYLAVRKTKNSIKGSVFKELNEFIQEQELSPHFKINLTDSTFTNNHTLNQIVCIGLDDPEKIKSIRPLKGVFTDIWIEEATEITEDDFRQLQRRMRGQALVPKRITMSFNPILRSHWICQRWFKDWADDERFRQQKDLLILKTVYKDNAFLDQYEINVLETEQNPYWKEVYTFGNWGTLGDVIFTNWKVKDIIADAQLCQTFDIFRNGLDFGYSNSPTAFNRIYYHPGQKRLYIIDEFNEKGITNEQIVKALKPKLNGDYLVCDSAEPKSIAELNQHGLSCGPARKGKDSILHGIQWLQQQEIIIDKRCQATINNFQQYQWEKDKFGDSINKPVDKANDHIDAIRYACEGLMTDYSDIEIWSADSKIN